MDEDGIVEDVPDTSIGSGAQSAGLFDLIFGSISSSISFIESNGWFILIGIVVFYLVYQKLKSSRSATIFSNSSSSSSSVKVNEDEALDRLQRIEAARQRQQALVDAAAAKYLEEKRLKEEKAAKEKQEEWEKLQKGLGYHSKMKRKDEDDLGSLGLSNPNKTDKPKLRTSDYNPLTGTSSSSSGGSCFYRPARRSGGSRGG